MSTDLTEEFKELAGGKRPTDEFIEMWTANNDARNCAVVGDPAVRMAEYGSSGSLSADRHGVVEDIVGIVKAFDPL